MRRWESVVCCSNTFLCNTIILFSPQNMILRCFTIHFNRRILPFSKWIHHFVKFIIAVDLGDIKKQLFFRLIEVFPYKMFRGTLLVSRHIVRSCNIVHGKSWTRILDISLTICPLILLGLDVLQAIHLVFPRC